MTMRYDQLEITVQNLREKLQDAKVKRNMLQIEKDMIHDFYYNTRKEIEEKEAKISNLDTKMQEEEQNHRTQITSYMQKVKHLDYDHLNNCEATQVKAKGEKVKDLDEKLALETELAAKLKEDIGEKVKVTKALRGDLSAAQMKVESQAKKLSDSDKKLKRTNEDLGDALGINERQRAAQQRREQRRRQLEAKSETKTTARGLAATKVVSE